MENGGTPKNLSEAIRMGLAIGQLKEIEQNLTNRLTELLNNRFGAAALRVGMKFDSPIHGEEVMELLEKLLAEIIHGPQKE